MNAYPAYVIVAGQMRDDGARIAVFLTERAQIARRLVGIVVLYLERVLHADERPGPVRVQRLLYVRLLGDLPLEAGRHRLAGRYLHDLGLLAGVRLGLVGPLAVGVAVHGHLVLVAAARLVVVDAAHDGAPAHVAVPVLRAADEVELEHVAIAAVVEVRLQGEQAALLAFLRRRRSVVTTV